MTTKIKTKTKTTIIPELPAVPEKKIKETVYVTSDGQEFPIKYQAEAHQYELDYETVNLINLMPFDWHRGYFKVKELMDFFSQFNPEDDIQTDLDTYEYYGSTTTDYTVNLKRKRVVD